MFSARIIVWMAIMAGLLVTPSFAQNLITNPSFCTSSSVTGESVARWDDIFFGPQEAEIFVDGFESGNLNAWSSAVP